MIKRILNAYLIEISRAIRLKSTFFGPTLMIIIILLTPFAYPIQQDNDSDYDFLAYVLPLSINVFGHFMTLIYAASLISTELSTGSIRMALTRPLRRREYLAAKALHGITYTVSLNLIALATALGLVQFLGNLTGIYFGDELIYSDSEMRQALLTTIALTLLPQCATISFALVLSTATRNSTAAIATAIGTWLFIETIKYPLNISQYVYSTYAESPWTIFNDRCNAFDASFIPSAYWGTGISLGYIIVFTSISLFILGRRNIVA
jgi:ABC-2 type transport system permease protein